MHGMNYSPAFSRHASGDHHAVHSKPQVHVMTSNQTMSPREVRYSGGTITPGAPPPLQPSRPHTAYHRKQIPFSPSSSSSPRTRAHDSGSPSFTPVAPSQRHWSKSPSPTADPLHRWSVHRCHNNNNDEGFGENRKHVIEQTPSTPLFSVFTVPAELQAFNASNGAESDGLRHCGVAAHQHAVMEDARAARQHATRQHLSSTAQFGSSPAPAQRRVSDAYRHDNLSEWLVHAYDHHRRMLRTNGYSMMEIR